MDSRQRMNTEIAPFEERFAAWQDAVQTAENHVKLGQTLQGQGIEILKRMSTQGGEPAATAKLVQQATATIERGVKVERDARREKLNLQQEKPKPKK